eukprot:12427-Heterococcus_DN1.PRE.1
MSRPPSKRKRAEENPALKDNDSDDDEDAGAEEAPAKQASVQTPVAKRAAYSSDEATRPGEEGGENQKFRKWTSFCNFDLSFPSDAALQCVSDCPMSGSIVTAFSRRAFVSLANPQRVSPTEGRTPVKWLPEEDERLVSAVKQFGDSGWRNIAEYVITKDPTQCMQASSQHTALHNAHI